MTSELRPEAVQPHFGQAQATRLGTLPTGLSFVINGTEAVRETYGQLLTEVERKAFFDEFLKAQRRGFPSAWVAIYETVDLIRQSDWYWKAQGFDSFDAFWQDQGQALFGQWAELEATYQYAHLAAPQLFEVQYEEAKALAHDLAQFRNVPAAKQHGGRMPGAKNLESEATLSKSAINAQDFMEEMNSTEWREGFEEGRKVRPGTDRFKRFARLRRDAPDIADRFLAGEFVRKFKNGVVEPDLKAAEIAAGIRKEGERTRQRDGLTYCKKLAKNLSPEQLQQLHDYITSILQANQ